MTKRKIKKLKQVVENINEGIYLLEQKVEYGAFLIFEDAKNELNKININLIKDLYAKNLGMREESFVISEKNGVVE